MDSSTLRTHSINDFFGELTDRMKNVDEQRLESDLHYRYEYVSGFVGFGSDDVSAIHSIAAKMLPLVSSMVEATYDKLLACDATRRHFVPRHSGYEGPLPANPASLTQSTEQIQFRKEHLARYLTNIFGNSYDARMVNYLDVVGKMHTPKAGNKRIDVPLVQMNALMGFVSDSVLGAILGLGLDREQEARTIRAVNKLLWIQNDLITRHYENPRPAADQPELVSSAG